MKESLKGRLIQIISKQKIQVLIVVALTAAVYANTLGNKFVWDDETFILGWPTVRTVGNIGEFFKGAYPAEELKQYRPVKVTLMSLNYMLFGREPFFYHLQAILIHLSATVLVYLVVREIFARGPVSRFPPASARSTKFDSNADSETRELRASGSPSTTVTPRKNPQLVAFLAALLFGLHPVHVEAITFVTSSTDILGIVFLLASFYFYLKQQEIGRRLTGNFWFALMFALLAFMTNEITLILPLLLIFYDLCFKHDFKVPFVKFYAPFFALAGGILAFRYFVLKIGSYSGYFADSIVTNMLLMPAVVIKYLSLLVLPQNLSINHEVVGGVLSLRYVDFNPMMVSRVNLFNPQVYWPAVLVICLVSAGVFCLKKAKILAFGGFWFLISLLPVLNIVPINILMQERYVYLASFGFCLLLAVSLFKLMRINGSAFEVKHLRLAAILLFIMTLAYYSQVTVMRNFDWKDSVSLWSKTVMQVGESALAHNNLGLAYEEQDKSALALREFEQAAAHNSLNFAKIYLNLAKLYIATSQVDMAFAELEKVLELYPNHSGAYYLLGEAYKKGGKTTTAIENYKKSIEQNFGYYEPHIGLGGIYIEQGKVEKAIEQFEIAKAIEPVNIPAYNNLGVIYAKQGKREMAIAQFAQALKYDPKNASVLKNLQSLMGDEPVQEIKI